MGLFDSKANTTQNQSTDNRAIQSGGDSNQNPISITTGKKSRIGGNVNIISTDHGAIQSAMALLGQGQEEETTRFNAMLGVHDSANRRAHDTLSALSKVGSENIAAASNVLDAANRRNTDLLRDVSSDQLAGSKNALEFASDSDRRAKDLQRDTLKAGTEQLGLTTKLLDASDRRNKDLQLSLADKSYNAVSKAVSGALSAVDASNRRGTDLQRDLAKGQNQSLLYTAQLVDTSNRRGSDLALQISKLTKEVNSDALEAMKSYSNNVFGHAKSLVEETNETTASLAKSVSIGDTDGMARIVTVLIIAVVATIVVVAAMFILGR